MPKGVHNRKPDNVHKLRGTYRKDRHGDEAEKVEFEDSVPEPPPFLDELAREAWFFVCGEMKTAGILKRAYKYTIAGFCTLWSQFSRNPAEFKDHTQLRQYLDALGLSPQAASRLKVPERKPKQGKFADV